ncbi:MAG: PD40 domain-containing protein, partial [Anaerolineales bacterium]|nr:PD40 domain-containing protein [Anaerolineales bacterium]
SQSVKVFGTYQIAGTDGWPMAAVWSHDGQWLAVNEWAADRNEAGLWLYRADGSEIQHLGSNTAEPVWSADSSQLLYVRYEQEGARSYFKLDLNSGAKQLFSLPGYATLVGWLEG